MNIHRFCILALLAGALVGCGGRQQASNPTSSVPTPTIAAAPLIPTSSPSAPTAAEPITAAPSPTTTPPPQPGIVTGFSYLWPSYLPDGMVVSTSESRIPNENEIGTTATGFYIITFNGGDRKLVVGGGATDTLPLSGETRQVTLNQEPATLTIGGEQRQLVFVRDRAKYFLYGRNISEQELLLVGESLLPNDVAALRDIVKR